LHGRNLYRSSVLSDLRLGWVSGATFHRAGEKHSTIGENIMLKRFLNNEDGATAIEYGLIAALIGVAIIVAVGAVGTELSTTFTTIKDKLGAAN
jgi:pilus assembly protein Flp/PilA